MQHTAYRTYVLGLKRIVCIGIWISC